MKQITVYYFPSFIRCGECGQGMEQIPMMSTPQRWAIVACQNFHARNDFPAHDKRNNCVNYGLKIKVWAREQMLDVIE